MTMKNLIKRLLHTHSWKTVKSEEVETYFNGKADGIMYIYVQECQECGKMRCYKFRS